MIPHINIISEVLTIGKLMHSNSTSQIRKGEGNNDW